MPFLVAETVARLPSRMDLFPSRGQLSLLEMINDLDDVAFHFPGYKMGARLIPPEKTLGFKSTPNLRIGTVLTACSDRGLKFSLGKGDECKKFFLGAGDHFLVPSDDAGSGPVTLSNLSRQTPCVVVLLTVIAKPLETSEKKSKLVQPGSGSLSSLNTTYKGTSKFALCSSAIPVW